MGGLGKFSVQENFPWGCAEYFFQIYTKNVYCARYCCMNNIGKTNKNSSNLQLAILTFKLIDLHDVLCNCLILGEWTLVLVLACKQLGIRLPATETIDNVEPGFMESIGLKDVRWYVLTNIVSSTAIYFTLGGFLHWFYYIRLRNEAKKWKCQPKR